MLEVHTSPLRAVLLPPADSTTDPHLSKRLLDTLEFWAKAAGAVTGLGIFVRKVLKPYQEWRRKHLADLMRDVLKDELLRLDGIATREAEHARERDDIMRELARIIIREDEIFNDIDAFLAIATDNRERIDEVNELLDATGFSSERRSGDDRRHIDDTFAALHERRRDRRRQATEDLAPRSRRIPDDSPSPRRDT